MAQQTYVHQSGTPSGSHTAGQKYRPIAWIVVGFIIASFALGGAAIIAVIVWLFWVAVGLVVLGTLVGWAAHILADEGGELPTDPVSEERGRGDET